MISLELFLFKCMFAVVLLLNKYLKQNNFKHAYLTEAVDFLFEINCSKSLMPVK